VAQLRNEVPRVPDAGLQLRHVQDDLIGALPEQVQALGEGVQAGPQLGALGAQSGHQVVVRLVHAGGESGEAVAEGALLVYGVVVDPISESIEAGAESE
jgi:hypothetical protein